jgi:alkyl sulfatase BDS1-like metallo-beta-lactamase superfamily hydrolase
LQQTHVCPALRYFDIIAPCTAASCRRRTGVGPEDENARGAKLTEALQLEGGLLARDKPVNIDLVRAVRSTPNIDDLIEAPVNNNLQFVRYLVDLRKAEEKSLSCTIGVEEETQLWQMDLRNSVLVISGTDSKAGTHVDLSRRKLAEFILGLKLLAEGNTVVAGFENSLDRSHLKQFPEGLGAGLCEPTKKMRCISTANIARLSQFVPIFRHF